MKEDASITLLVNNAGVGTVAQRQLRNVEEIMYTVLSNWIYIGSNAYDEYTFVSWLNRNVYRRTVDLARVCLL